MTSASPPSTPFFVAGGTVPPGSPSYVERAADRELLEALLAGEFCYVLNARQMGKSSLAVRTIDRLEERGVRTAFVDLTRIGGATVTPEQWYAGILVEAGRALGLRTEAATWVKAHRDLGPAQRLLSFLHEEVLNLVEGPIVLMIDEIDAVRSLSFSTDELFAGLRHLHNGRATDPRLQRLTVCLLGAALPSDLIVDPRVTPFNVGRRIDLRDFTPEEASPFASQIGVSALRRILHWTGGHPFLTQALCAELTASSSPSGSSWRGGQGERLREKDIDALVQSRYLDARARETDTNLADVGRRLLGEGDPDVGEGNRADVLSAYRRMLSGRAVPDDEANVAAARIKMSGIARPTEGGLRLRNRIYRRAFDRRWVLENLPNQELRRQRKAFWKGAIRASIVAVIFCALSALVISFSKIVSEDRSATSSRKSLDEDLDWLSSLDARRRNHQTGLPLTYSLASVSPGWEMAYWRHATGNAKLAIDTGDRIEGLALRDDSRTAACLSTDRISLVDLETRRVVAKLRNDHHLTQAQWLRHSRTLLAWSDDDRSIDLWGIASGKILRSRMFDTRILVGGVAPDDRWALQWKGGVLSRLDLSTFQTSPFSFRVESPQRLVLSPDGTRAVVWDLDPEGQRTRVVDLTTGRVLLTVEEQVVDGENRPGGAAFVPGSSHLLLGRLDGSVRLFDLASAKLLGSTRLSAEGPIVEVSVEGAGRRAVAVDSHRQSFLIDLGSGAPIVRNRFDDSYRAAILPNGTAVIDVADSLRIRPVDSAIAVPERNLHTTVEGRIFSPDGSARVPSGDGLQAFDLRHLDRPARHIALPGTAVPDSTGRFWRVATSSKVEIFDSRGAHVGMLPRSLGPFDDFAVDGSGKRLFGVRAQTIAVVDLPTGRMERQWKAAEPLADLFLSPDGHTLVTRSQRGDLMAFDALSGKPRWSKTFDRNGLTAIACFSPNSRWLATGRYDHSVNVLEASTGEFQPGINFFNGRPTVLSWTSDGSRLFVGCEDGAIRVFGRVVDPGSFYSSKGDPSWANLGVVARHAGPIVGLMMLPGDRTLASIDRGGTIRLWMTSDRL